MLTIEQLVKIYTEDAPSDYEREPLLDLSDGDDLPADEDELTKAAILKAHYRDHFEVEDPTDGMTDDELWQQVPWRKDDD